MQKSMENRGVACELRVITDRELESSIHDRWILSKTKNFNIPSPDIIARGQYSEIKETRNKPPFEEWWNKSTDIITEWNRIVESNKQDQNSSMITSNLVSAGHQYCLPKFFSNF